MITQTNERIPRWEILFQFLDAFYSFFCSFCNHLLSTFAWFSFKMSIHNFGEDYGKTRGGQALVIMFWDTTWAKKITESTFSVVVDYSTVDKLNKQSKAEEPQKFKVSLFSSDACFPLVLMLRDRGPNPCLNCWLIFYFNFLLMVIIGNPSSNFKDV